MEKPDKIAPQLSDLLNSFEQYLDVTVDESQDDQLLATIRIDAPLKRTSDDDTLSITDTVAELLIRLQPVWEHNQPFLVHVKTTQGTGKTTGMMETAAVQLEPTAAFGPRHTDVETDAEKLQAWDGVHFIGKDKGCINSDFKGKHASVHHNISTRWCNNCEKKSVCPVFDPYRDLKNGVTNLTGAHEHLLHLPQVLSRRDENFWAQISTVLIDESPWDAIVEETITIELTDINNTIDALDELCDDEDVSYENELLEQLQTALKTLKREIRRDRIADALDVLTARPEYDYTREQCTELREAMKKASKFARGRSIDSCIDALARDQHTEYDQALLTRLRTDLTAVDYELRKGDHNQTPFELLREACETANETDGLLDELAERHATDLEQGISYQNVLCNLAPRLSDILESWEQTITEGRTLTDGNPPEELWQTTGGQLELTYLSDTLAKIAESKPTFVLATEFPTEKLVSAIDIPIIVIEDSAAPKMKAFQLETKNAGITTLRESSNTLATLLELTKFAVQREVADGNTTFIAAKQELVEDIETYLTDAGYALGSDFKIGHYYNLTGSNRFEDCEAVVLFGSPRWSDDNVIATRVLTGVSREILHYEGQEGELRDGVHRTRPLRNPARLYALTAALDLDDVLAATSTRFGGGVPELRKRLKREAQSAQKRASLCEDILSYLSSCEGNPTKTELVNSLGASQHLDAALNELEVNGEIESHQVSNGKPGRNPTRFRRPIRST